MGQVLIEEEKMEIGGVKWSIYRYYGKSVGVAWTCTCLLMFLLYQAFQLGGNIWLSGAKYISLGDAGLQIKLLTIQIRSSITIQIRFQVDDRVDDCHFDVILI